jgi:nucleoredoxin
MLRTLVILLLATLCGSAAPVTMKELQFLVRQGTPPAEILQAVSERRLLEPLTPEIEQTLRAGGASDALVAALKQPGMALSAAESHAERLRRMEHEAGVSQLAQQDAAFLAQKRQQEQQTAAYMRRSGMIRAALKDKLVRLDGDQLKPYDEQQLDGVRLYAFYYSAMWCGPCRKFTPQLIEAYQRLKTQYPNQFELIFVSSDRDEFNMHEYMRSHRMPWPAVRFGSVDDSLRQFSGGSIPWLVAVSEAGMPLTRNGVDKKYIAPEAVLGGIEQLLAQLKR